MLTTVESFLFLAISFLRKVAAALRKPEQNGSGWDFRDYLLQPSLLLVGTPIS